MFAHSPKGVLYWGWVRLALGMAQMGLAMATAVSFLQDGFAPLTWSLVVCACAATGLSRYLYRGKPGPGAAQRAGLPAGRQ